MFRVQIKVFEGPLELLLHLIRDNQLDIADIPIVEITSRYLEYLELMKELNLEIAGEFLVMAATLVHIKSRMLLPRPSLQDVEEVEADIAELKERLKEYEKFRLLGTKLHELHTDASRRWQRGTRSDGVWTKPKEDLQVGLYPLLREFNRLLARQRRDDIEKLRITHFSVKEKISFILDHLAGVSRCRFSTLFNSFESREEMIAAFLALLELIRCNLVRVSQKKAFGPIWLRRAVKEDTDNG